MIDFWEQFQREPDSIRTTARRAYVREIVAPVGNQRVSTLMVDMAALAAHHPSVARALERVQLTPQRHDAYRVAIFSALVYENATDTSDSTNSGHYCSRNYPTSEATIAAARVRVGPNSILAQNLAFLDRYWDDLQALAQTAIWVAP